MRKGKPVQAAGETSLVKKISLVTPIYRELYNGNAETLLNNLRDQNFDSSRLNVVLIVNNNKDVAADLESLIRKENQETLVWLERVIQEKRYSFSIHVLDHSSQGIERNMGIIRQKGVNLLLAASDVPPDHHIVVHMDTDTRFESGFFKKLESYYTQFADLKAVFFNRGYELRGTPTTAMLRTHPEYALRRAFRDMKVFFNTHQEGFATYQISSRASTIDAVGGFKPLERGEDTQFSIDLMNENYVFAGDLMVRTEDRSRPDGFTSALRHERLESGETKKLRVFPNKLLFYSAIEKLSMQVEQNKISLNEATACFEHLVRSLKGEKIKAKISKEVLHQEGGAGVALAFHEFLFKKMQNPGRKLFLFFFSQLPKGEQTALDNKLDTLKVEHERVVEIRRSHLLRMGSNAGARDGESRDPFVAWAQFANLEFDAFLTDNGLKTASPARMTLVINKQLPGWISSFSESSAFTDLAHMHALLDFLADARQSPGRYPATAAILSRLQ